MAYNVCLGSHASSETRLSLLCAGQLMRMSGSAVQELQKKHLASLSRSVMGSQ